MEVVCHAFHSPLPPSPRLVTAKSLDCAGRVPQNESAGQLLVSVFLPWQSGRIVVDQRARASRGSAVLPSTASLESCLGNSTGLIPAATHLICSEVPYVRTQER